jgi:SAM-dependent methyltransferase
VTNHMAEVFSPITGAASSLLSEVCTKDLCRLYHRHCGIDVSRHFREIDRLQYRECLESGVRFFYPFCPGDEAFYTELSKHSWYYAANKEEYRYAGTRLSEAASILDVGCGVGKFAETVPHARFVGLEFSASAVRAGTNVGRTIHSMPIEDHARDNANAYDAVTAFQVLEHVTDPVEFCRGIVSCARPGGLVIIGVPAEDGAFGARVNYTLNLPPHHLTHWTDRALTFVMAMEGLININLHHLPLDPGDQIEAITQFLGRVIGGPRFHKKLIRIGLAERLLFATLRVAAKTAHRGIVAPFAWGHTVVATGQKPG